jgi:hypothetical protein
MQSNTALLDASLKFATRQRQILLTHPYFTGQCPECHTLLSAKESTPKRCWCVGCGWNDLPN